MIFDAPSLLQNFFVVGYLDEPNMTSNRLWNTSVINTIRANWYVHVYGL